jgi:hypothetical protein
MSDHEDVDHEGTNEVPGRSRRQLLGTGLAALGGAVAATAINGGAAEAAAGSPLVLGSLTNNSGATGTKLTNSATRWTLELYNAGWFPAAYCHADKNHGVVASTKWNSAAGVQASNTAPAGSGSAVQASGGQNIGVDATTVATDIYAVRGRHLGAAANGGVAILGDGGLQYGVIGVTNDIGSAGVFGVNAGTNTDAGGVGYGVVGEGWTGVGGIASDTLTESWGLHGVASATTGSLALRADGDSEFDGDVDITGTLTKGGGTFKIDHPLDPANKYLSHSFVESPDMMNIYNGVATLDSTGAATVALPDWFGSLNRDFRYQLTAIGSAAPDLHVKTEVSDNRFSIAGGKAGQKVSWQVTGVRQDAWANAHRVKVETAKTGVAKGRFLHPAEHGKSSSQSIAAAQARGRTKLRALRTRKES